MAQGSAHLSFSYRSSPGAIAGQMGLARWAGTGTGRKSTARERSGPDLFVLVPGPCQAQCRAWAAIAARGPSTGTARSRQRHGAARRWPVAGVSPPPQSPSLTLNHSLSLQFSIDQDPLHAPPPLLPPARPRAARAPALSPRAAAVRPRPPAVAASSRRRPRPLACVDLLRPPPPPPPSAPAGAGRPYLPGRRRRHHPTSPPPVLPLLCSAPGRRPPPPCCRAPGARHGTPAPLPGRAWAGMPARWHYAARHGGAAVPRRAVPPRASAGHARAVPCPGGPVGHL